MRKHINSCTTKNSQRISTYVTSMKINHQERTIKNVITPPPNPPNQHPAYQHLRHFNEDEHSRAYYISRTLSHHPPNSPNQHPAYQHLRHFNEDEASRPYYQIYQECYRVLQKKQPSTGNHRDTLLTPSTSNFNVVIGSAEHHQQKWLFFLKAAKHKIQKTTLNWGTGGGMTSLVWYFMGWLFFLKNPDPEKTQ